MSTSRTLFIDADDTLWENNIYYERVIAEFAAALCARGVPPGRVRQAIWETEQRNIRVTGYGSRAFCNSLHEVARSFGVADLDPQIRRWEDFIFHHPVELMPGVKETVPVLCWHNRLILLTRGHGHEQVGKLQRSGLATYFSATEVVFEKSTETYRSLLAKYGVAAANAWMVGNSPRFDINPAKAAGLGTVW
ncbi:MAG: HAD hydrolase-like protein, partial [Verrucomicrobiae bacterium]|nr:HAD hydrolase-like protein [Verrucomicrobiae bacterium]